MARLALRFPVFSSPLATSAPFLDSNRQSTRVFHVCFLGSYQRLMVVLLSFARFWLLVCWLNHPQRHRESRVSFQMNLEEFPQNGSKVPLLKKGTLAVKFFSLSKPSLLSNHIFARFCKTNPAGDCNFFLSVTGL